jgi:DNA polymerase III delta prime subunit
MPLKNYLAGSSFLITGGSSVDRLEKAKEIAPDALELDVSKVEEIRNLIKMASQGFSVIITQAQNLTVAAQNALLKTLEEPPENTVIILLAEKENQLLPTILSRCVISHLSNLSPLSNLESIEILNWSLEKGFAWAEKSRLDRTEAISLVKNLQISGHRELLKNQINQKVLGKLILAQKYLEANTNVRLTLENLFIK